MKHLLSFDLEEWFHIINNDHLPIHTPSWDKLSPRIEFMTEKLLAFLRSKNIRATFFVLGWVAEKYPKLISRLASENHEIGCHSHLHRPVWSQTPTEFASDLKLALSTIAQAGGVRPKIFRAPGFSIDARALWAFDILAKEGIELDSSIFPGRHSHGGLPHAPTTPFTLQTAHGKIREFPISTFSFFGKRITFSGGGFFRILPLPLQRNRFAAFDRLGYPVITYFHPRDFDTDIPENDCGWLRDFKNNINVANALQKLSTLVDEFPMATLSEVDRAIDWSRRPTLNVDELATAPTLPNP